MIFTSIAGFFAKPLGKFVAGFIFVAVIAIAATAVIRSIYNKGESAGENHVITDVQKKTIDEQEKARIQREQINEQIRTTPYDGRVDQLN